MTRATFALLLVLAQAVAPPPASQSGEDTGQIRGRVTDKDTGAPLPYAHVTLMEPTLKLERTATTDDAGVFRFTGLPPGKYDGVVTAGSYRSTHDFQGLPASRPPASIELTKGAVREINIALSRTRTIPVRVVDEFGDPLSEVFLSAFQAPAMDRVAVPMTSHDRRPRPRAGFGADARTLRGVRRHPRCRRIADGQELGAPAAVAHVLSVGGERGRRGTRRGRSRSGRRNRNPHAPRTDLHHFGHRAGRIGRACGRRAGRMVRVQRSQQQQWIDGFAPDRMDASASTTCVQAPTPSRLRLAGPTGRSSGARAKRRSSRFAWSTAMPKMSSSR